MSDNLDKDMLLLATRIREARKKAGLTQLELSMKSGVSQNMIAYIEKGERNPALRTVIKLCRAMDVKMSDILSEIENESSFVSEEREKIKEEMDRIIALDLPFNRKIVSNEEALKIFHERGFDDKIDILKYRPEKNCHTYECDGYENYMYGYMVPSTGYLSKFKLFSYDNQVVVQYPRYENNGEIPSNIIDILYHFVLLL